MFAAICIAVIISFAAIVFLGARSGKLQHFFKVHPRIPKILVLGYRERMVCVVTFILTVIGMACRYLLEFGEVSNTYNFTLFNIVSYLVIIPIGTTIFYRFMVRRLKR